MTPNKHGTHAFISFDWVGGAFDHKATCLHCCSRDFNLCVQHLLAPIYACNTYPSSVLVYDASSPLKVAGYCSNFNHACALFCHADRLLPDVWFVGAPDRELADSPTTGARSSVVATILYHCRNNFKKLIILGLLQPERASSLPYEQHVSSRRVF